MILLVVMLLVIDLHQSSSAKMLALFEQHQILHSEYLVSEIQLTFWKELKELQSLSSQSIIQQKGSLSEIDLNPNGNGYVKATSIHDKSGKITSSTDHSLIGKTFDQREMIEWARKKENRGKIFISSLSHLEYLFVMPLYRTVFPADGSKAKEEFIGFISADFDAEKLLWNQAKHPNLKPHEIWIMDSDGTLVFHSHHPEMAFRNIHQRGEGCDRCHVTLDYVGRMLKARQGATTYQVSGYPKKVADFFPMRFENLSWVVVVSSDYDSAIAFMKDPLRRHFILLVIAVLAMLGILAHLSQLPDGTTCARGGTTVT